MRHQGLGKAVVVSMLAAVVPVQLLLQSAAAQGGVQVSSSSVQLSPSVMLIGKFDWQIDPASPPDAPWSRCLDMVWRAAAVGSDRVNFVPTHHWLPPRGSSAASNAISGFCYMHHTQGDANACSPWNDDVIAEYRSAMTLCFTEALRQGMTIYVRPHLDDGTGNGAWRNGLLLQPELKYGGYSYYDLMLAPLADALRDALAAAAREEVLHTLPGRKRPVVYFAMQGEMSATIMRFASEWGRLVAPLKSRISSTHADVELGIGLNFNRLDDVTSVAKTYDSSRLSWLMWQLGAETTSANVPPVDVAGLKNLLQSQLDFVGISAYAPYTGPGMPLNEFENAAFMFADEMRDAYGIDVRSLVNSGKLELHYSEFGLGGGNSYGGTQIALSAGEVALRPFFGIYGPYSSSKDPWAISGNRAYLREFYSKAMAWLSNPGIRTYHISSVFIWSMASWDVLGIYPESTSPQGSYRDPVIAESIANYNRRVVKAQGGAAIGGTGSSSDLPASGRR